MIACAIALAFFAPKTFALVPKETVWVYENASSPADGTLLRAWGAEGRSCPNEGEDLAQFSFSFLKWDLSDVPRDAKLLKATLDLNNIPDPGFTIESAKRAPLEVRALIGEFDAKTWTFDKAAKVRPNGAKVALYGSGYPLTIRAGAPVEISIDLLSPKSTFAKALSEAGKSLSLTITSAMDPSAEGRASIYKLYGQSESKESLRPVLKLTFEQPTYRP